MRRRLATLGLALAIGLAFAATAGARIVLGQSIGGVSLGMTMGQVHARLGPGTQEEAHSPEYDYRHDTYQVAFGRGRVTDVTTFNRRDRTPRGLGVGVTLARLRREQPDLHCFPTRSEGDRDCVVGSLHRGHRYTDFYLANARTVSSITVGLGYV